MLSKLQLIFKIGEIAPQNTGIIPHIHFITQIPVSILMKNVQEKLIKITQLDYEKYKPIYYKLVIWKYVQSASKLVQKTY